MTTSIAISTTKGYTITIKIIHPQHIVASEESDIIKILTPVSRLVNDIIKDEDNVFSAEVALSYWLKEKPVSRCYIFRDDESNWRIMKELYDHKTAVRTHEGKIFYEELSDTTILSETVEDQDDSALVFGISSEWTTSLITVPLKEFLDLTGIVSFISTPGELMNFLREEIK